MSSYSLKTQDLSSEDELKQALANLGPHIDPRTAETVHLRMWPSCPKGQRVEETKSVQAFIELALDKLASSASLAELDKFVGLLREENVNVDYVTSLESTCECGYQV